jgi:hypothetical protein
LVVDFLNSLRVNEFPSHSLNNSYDPSGNIRLRCEVEFVAHDTGEENTDG